MNLKTLLGSLSMAVAAMSGISTSDVMAGCPCQNRGQVPAGSISTPIPEYAAGAGSMIPNTPPVAVYGGSVTQAPFGAEQFVAPPVMASPVPGGISSGIPTNEVPVRSQVPATGVPGVGPGYSGATATTWQPPPGTLGRTYQMKSRPVPVTMHPRAAIVDVRVKDADSVRVHDMNVARTQDYLEGFQDHEDNTMWHFTAEPMIPGIPHIYRIEARFTGPDGKETMQERYVRLIMGRVIEVEI